MWSLDSGTLTLLRSAGDFSNLAPQATGSKTRRGNGNRDISLRLQILMWGQHHNSPRFAFVNMSLHVETTRKSDVLTLKEFLGMQTTVTKPRKPLGEVLQ